MSSDAGSVTLTRLSIEQVANLLQRAGALHMTPERIRADLAAGAPGNPDKSINLIAYGAWMLQELARREGRHE